MYKFLTFVSLFIASSSVISKNNFNESKEDNGSVIFINGTFTYYTNASEGKDNNFTNITINESINYSMQTFPETTEITTPPSGDEKISETRILERNLELLDFCTCDLTASSCDINCCCDPDCSQDNMKAFVFCKPGKKFIDKLYCIGEHILYANNTPYRAQIISNDLLCIITDNLKDRHYYPNIKGIDSIDAADEYITRKTFYPWVKSPRYAPSEVNKNSFGEIIKVSPAVDAEEVLFKPFELPTSFPSSECQITESILYLEDFVSSCTIHLQSLPLQCESNPLFSAKRFEGLNFITWMTSQEEKIENEDFTYTTTSQDVTIFLNITNENSTASEKKNEESTEIPTEFNATDYTENTGEALKFIPVKIFLCEDISNEYSCFDSKTILNPSYHKGECRNVLKSVHFSFIHNGTYGIQEVEAKIELMTVNRNTKFINQFYKVTYQWVDINETNVYEKSGSPGYAFGMPILMGSLNTVNNVTEDDELGEKIYLDKNPNNWMTIASASGSAECTQRLPVKFGINLYSECELFVKIDRTERPCSQLKNKSLLKLLSYEYDLNNPFRVGMYGDSNVLLSVEWVPILFSEDLDIKIGAKDTEELRDEFLCTNIVTSIKIEIIYALQGPFQNPQAKIIGTLIKLGRTSTLDLSQYKRNDIPDSFLDMSIGMELITEVVFVDITEESKREYPEPPRFDIKLPYDFFYPFLPSSSSKNRITNCFMILIIIVIAFR